jgi:Restriction endonuclease
MQAELVARAISGISPNTTFDEFRSRSGIVSMTVAKDVLQFLNIHGIGSVYGNVITFSQQDRLKTAIIALNMGCDIESVSKKLGWKDFESLASEVLHLLGYVTETNVRFTKPRTEIDVIGVHSKFAIVADCKHWKRTSISLMTKYARKQVQRTGLLLDIRKNKINSAVPIILTLHSERVQFIDKTPIVPISKFRSFLHDVQNYLPEILVIPAP